MSLDNPRILIIDDDPDVVLSARLLLKPHYSLIQTENDPYRLNALLKQHDYDVVLLDMNFRTGASSGEEGLQWMKKILRQSPRTSVILMTAYAEIPLAVKAIRDGASDFVVKPWDNAAMLASVAAAAEAAKHASDEGADEHTLSGTIIGESQAMQRVLQTVQKVARTEASVLILGENGTGKEVIAQAIHNASLRNTKPFAHIDVGAIPESLFESELFGHRKGAFTDAREDRAGRFESANGGTIFLDEIGNIPLQLQAKLLSVLQARQVMRIGSSQLLPIDVRLVCATNAAIHDLVRDGRFRQDLLYRINTVEVHLPPLRERGDDVLLLAQHFLKLYAQKYSKEGLELTDSACDKLMSHDWPGNVRELQHAMERAVILCEANAITADDFLWNAATILEGQGHPSDLNLEHVEKQAIQDAILKYDGNLSQAAKALGLGRTTLYRKMTRYGI